MDIAGVSSLISGLRATKDLATAAIELTNDTRIVDQLNRLVRQVSDTQSNLLDTQSQIGDLINEKHQLESRLRAVVSELEELKSAVENLSRYELVEVAPHSFLYHLKEDASNKLPAHFACPNCFAKKRISILQWSGAAAHIHLTCPDCTKVFVGPKNEGYKPPQRRKIRSSSFR